MKALLSPTRVIPFSLFLVTAAVNISMPLFRPYAAEAGLNNGQTALVLATYIIGMLPCYVFLGGISDVVGRKPILIISLFCALASNVIIMLYPNIYALIVCRLFQGIGLGLSMGTGTAYLAEIIHPEPNAATRAANAASLSTAIGFSGGAFATTITLLINFTLTPVTYYFFVGLTIVGLIAAFGLPKLPPIGGKSVRLPYYPDGSFPINLSIAICWAAVSLVIAIVPSQLASFGLKAYAGFGLVLINWTGAFIQPWVRKNFKPETSMRIGFVLTPLGFGLVVLGCYLGMLPIIFLGAATLGTSAYGFSYQGGLAIISQLGGVQRARAVSGFMFIGYIGFGIPAIFIGYLADRLGIVGGFLVFETIIVLLCTYLFATFKPKHIENRIERVA
jgi:MFS family permease